jgi:phosphoesterase RecJ-like protein
LAKEVDFALSRVEKMLSQVVELIESNSSFGITSHARPDGDGIGSSLGLYWLLRSLGKEAEVFFRDEIPVSYRELPGAENIKTISKADKHYDAVFVIECSDVSRPGIEGLEDQQVVNIDHHATCEHFGDVNWIDSTASAVGEMIYNLCKAIGGKVSPEIANCVYMALVADTGSFHYSNTTERTFKVASELVRFGVKPHKISEAVYNSYPWSRVELMAKVMATIKRSESGRIAWLRQDLEMVDESGAVDGDNNGFVNLPLMAKDVVAVVFMKEVRPETYRVSLRSKGDINVAKVAEKFGGGGHKNAAGCRVTGDWDANEQEIINAVTEAVERSQQFIKEREEILEPALA